MARPTDAGSFAEALYEQLQPLTYAEEALDYPLLKYLGAAGQMLQDIDELAHSDSTWSALVDIDRIPDVGLEWFAQIVGVTLEDGATPSEWRQQIRDHEQWNRGTVAAMRKAAQKSGGLTGNKSVLIRERTPDAYSLTVITYPSETIVSPNRTYDNAYFNFLHYSDLLLYYYNYGQIWLESSGVSVPVLEALLSEKPAGLVLNYIVSNAQDYWSLWRDYLTYALLYGGLTTYADAYVYSSTAGSPGFFAAVTGALTYGNLYDLQETYGNILDNYVSY